MMDEFARKLDFDSDTFSDLKRDMNFVLQRLLGNMLDSETTEGSMTLKIDVNLVEEWVPNYDPKVQGESRKVSKPQFKHKVTSAIKINDEKSGNMNNEMELYFDDETGTYQMRPIANTTQRSIFDADFREASEGDQKCVNDADAEDGQNVIEGATFAALPGPTAESEEDIVDVEETKTVDAEVIDGKVVVEGDTVVDDEAEPEDAEDITDELMGGDDAEGDDYQYDDPEE